MSRTVIVASARANAARKITDFTGTTWGELKSHATVSALYSSDLEAVVNPGNATLRGDDSLLPEGDFKVYLIPTKNKAGMTEQQAKQLGEAISKAIMDGVKIVSDEEIEALKENVEKAIDNFFNENNDADCSECDEALREARNL